MTTVLRPALTRAETVLPADGFLSRFQQHRSSLLVLVAVLAGVGVATGWNLQGWPGRVNDDEGTYVAEAWAVLYPHHLSHYTFWYDHPPFGWIQISAYIGVTNGFARDASAVMSGREFMWWVTLISSTLIFVLCRRLGFRRVTAAVSVLAYGLSPLAVYYHRMVSLDNIGTMWLLAALVCAASRRRSLAAAFGTAVCMAGAVLSKETLAVLLPVVLWVLWRHSDQRTRRWHFGIFAVTFVVIAAVYPLFALLRDEMLPGNGHVSLAWALWWQFFGRTGSGSLLDTHSGTYGIARLWTGLDPWLLLAGTALVPAGLAIKRLRPLALALLLPIVVMFKGGYVPYFYVTAMLPFAAMLIGGVADWLLEPVTASRSLQYVGRPQPLGLGLVAAAAALLLIFVLPGWWNTLSSQSKVRGATAELAATAWIEKHVPKRDVVVVDDYMWPDLKLRGWNPLWLWKVNTDPQVTKDVLPHGYRSIQYIVLDKQATSTQTTLAVLPTLEAALAHSKIVRTFSGGFIVRRVIDN